MELEIKRRRGRAAKASRDELLQRRAFVVTSGVDCWRFNPAVQITAIQVNTAAFSDNDQMIGRRTSRLRRR
jgi:hypothetical protein